MPHGFKQEVLNTADSVKFINKEKIKSTLWYLIGLATGGIIGALYSWWAFSSS